MWPLYNVLQILCIITIMDIKTPPNATLVMAEIKNGIELNFIPLESLLALVPEDEEWLYQLVKSGGMLAFICVPVTVAGWVVTIMLYLFRNHSMCCFKAHKKV